MENIFNLHWGGWLLTSGLLGFAFYTLWVIRKEGSSYYEQSQEIALGHIAIRVPNWWSIIQQNQNFWRFERKDTRYEWYCELQFLSSHSFLKIEDVFDNLLQEKKVAFDPEVQVTTESKHLFFISKTSEEITECLRVEGTATQDKTKRIYWDVYLFRLGQENSYYIFESWSSVLNGMLEGPYFEEAVSQMHLQKNIKDFLD